MSARNNIYKSVLTEAAIAKEMARVLPKRNNYGIINYPELLNEAKIFGVNTRGSLRRVLLRHRKRLLQIDREPIDKLHVRIFSEDYGYENVIDLLRRQMWCSWEAQMRIALELEFGQKYEEFARVRDGF